MRSLSLTMPAALLLLLCLACNSSNQKVGLLSKKMEDVELKSTSPATNNEVSKEFTSMAADSVSTGTIANAAPQPEDEQSPPKSSTGQHPAQSSATVQQTAPANPDWDKKIVKTANLNLEVKNYKSFNDLLHRTVKQSGGYIAQEEQNESGYKIENTVTIKVPVAQFDETLSQLASDSSKLLEKKISAEDVSMQIVDTKSRLETKKEVRERYLELLKEARNMKDILSVQNEINDIQEQMEGAAGRIAYLSHSAAFSTINLSFYQVLDAGASNEPDPSFLHKIKVAFAEGWNWISALLLGLISLWPLWIAVGLAWKIFWKGRSSYLRTRPDTRLSNTAAGVPKE